MHHEVKTLKLLPLKLFPDMVNQHLSSKPHKMWRNGIEPRLAMTFQPKLPIYEEGNQN